MHKILLNRFLEAYFSNIQLRWSNRENGGSPTGPDARACEASSQRPVNPYGPIWNYMSPYGRPMWHPYGLYMDHIWTRIWATYGTIRTTWTPTWTHMDSCGCKRTHMHMDPYGLMWDWPYVPIRSTDDMGHILGVETHISIEPRTDAFGATLFMAVMLWTLRPYVSKLLNLTQLCAHCSTLGRLLLYLIIAGFMWHMCETSVSSQRAS